MKACNVNGILTIQVPDRMDALNAADVQKELLALIDGAGEVRELVLDAEKLEYISSAGLRVILLILERAKLPLSMKNVEEVVYTVLKMTGLTGIIKIAKRNAKDEKA